MQIFDLTQQETISEMQKSIDLCIGIIQHMKAKQEHLEGQLEQAREDIDMLMCEKAGVIVI